MKKIFISQPMRNLSDEKIKEERDLALKKFTYFFEKKYPNETFKVLDSFFDDFNGNGIAFLGKSLLDCLSEADIVIFAPNWSSARGCKIEHDVAVAYGLEVFYTNNNS